MSEFKEFKVKAVVKSSTCELYKKGDTIYFDGPLLDKEKSDNVCLTAVNAFYPFVYAARKRVTAEQMGFEELTFHCPDCAECAEFTLIQY